ncbi:DUF4199 domain-containing protein [Fodinibius sediminis]|uniref:DUF4199 domain-containing protein n=1 Tax=Fodinibius sediminis TaxID=1214077 RepID=A0A521F499_9BACT|nr:DUF4199 domain-containing protein [Fodinibius sediminis]SMO90969.1 Protein of unknown function [Fodinibius sediminis]
MEELPRQEFDSPYQGTDGSSEPSYWTSVTMAGVLFGIVAFILSLVSSYAIINSEPTGTIFSPTQLLGTLACLLGAFGGMVATWHYIREFDLSIKLGRGALIGFLTGVCIAIVSVVLNQVWQFVDPDMTQKVIESTIANMEAMDMPEAQKQQMIDATAESVRDQTSIGSQLLWGVPLYGILNLFTGMIGAKIFSKQQA